MCPQKSARIILLLAVAVVLGGCGALDAILPSTGTYKINAKINDTPLDDFSIVTSKDKIQPFFEEAVSDDPDITELVVFLKDSRGLTTGYKVTYSLIINNNEDEQELQTEQNNSKTENKDEDVLTGTDKGKETNKDSSDEKKKDETVSTAADKSKETNKESRGEKKKDETVSTAADKSKETNKDGSGEKNKDEAVSTTTDKSKETNKDGSGEKNKDGAVSTTTDKSKETNKDEAVSTAADKNKEDKKESNKETFADNTEDLDTTEHNKNDNEIIFLVKSFDENLPFLPLPADLPIGKYTIIFQIKSKNTILYKYEKPLFYLADAEFSFEGIQVHMPGIAENSQFIQNKNVILLDINLIFDSRLDPYIIWYNGKKVIDEGNYSDGAGSLLWKAPEQNGFVSLRAEVFPSWERTGLTGYQKGISLLVSSKEVDMHLLSGDTPNLVQWYTFEGDLNDSLTKGAEELFIEPVEKNKLNWLPSNGTYGLASGTDYVYKLPNISFTNNANETWQIISRFKPLNEGEIMSVKFGISSDVTMTLSNKASYLVLTLASVSKTYSESLKLPDDKDSFVSVSVKFFIQAGRLSAKMALEKSTFVKPAFILVNNKNEAIINPISIEADFDKEFQILLGQQQINAANNTQTAVIKKQAFTALWDELAILRHSAVEKIILKKETKETLTELTAVIEEEPPEISPPPPPGDFSNLLE